MERSASVLKIFNQHSVEQDEVSPSITLRRVRLLSNGAPDTCDLVYTENLWAAINNTLAGCAEFSAWQQAQQWIVVTDEANRGDATTLLEGCECLADSAASVEMVDCSGFSSALQTLQPNTPTVVVLALSTASIEDVALQADTWHKANDFSESNRSALHLLWLPHERATQTQPVNVALEALSWASVTVVCDLAKLSNEKKLLNESLVTMLRAAVFIDAQFLHWIEGNLSALANGDEELHRKAIMRTANALFMVKRRRSEEPAIPMAFSDTVALRYSHAVSAKTPVWQVRARQLLLDIRYAIATEALAPSAAERMLRVMTSLQLITAAEDTSLIVSDEPLSAFVDRPFLLLEDFGSAHVTREFAAEAWHEAIKSSH